MLEQLDSRQPPPYTRTLKAVPSLKAWHQTMRPTQFTPLQRRATTHHGTTNEQEERHPPKSKSSSQTSTTKSPESPRIKHTFKIPFGHADACPSAVERRVIWEHNSCNKMRWARTVSIWVQCCSPEPPAKMTSVCFPSSPRAGSSLLASCRVQEWLGVSV